MSITKITDNGRQFQITGNEGQSLSGMLTNIEAEGATQIAAFRQDGRWHVVCTPWVSDLDTA